MTFNRFNKDIFNKDEYVIIPNPESPKYKIYKDGRVYSFHIRKFMKQRMRKDGYLDLQINKKSKLIHRLVAEAFIGASELAINHKDGNKTNNNINNLEYVTASENIRHSIDVLGNKHVMYGDLNGNNKIKSKEYPKILTMYCLGISRGMIAEMYNVNKETISFIMIKYDNRTYRHAAKIHNMKSRALRWKGKPKAKIKTTYKLKGSVWNQIRVAGREKN